MKSHILISKKAKVEIRFTEGSIPIRINTVYGPKNKNHSISEKVKVFAVSVKEINPPKGVDALDLTLLTNLEVRTVTSALEKVSWYGLRWNIGVSSKGHINLVGESPTGVRDSNPVAREAA